MKIFLFFLIISFCFKSYASRKIHIAVAANFIEPFNEIKKKFLKINNGLILVSKGSTAKLYSQIMNNAPIDFFLSADQKTIFKIPQHKKITKSQFTYAIGKISFFSKSRIDNLNEIFAINDKKRIVIANPKLSPYGEASKIYLKGINVWSLAEKNIILASNINQVSSFIYSGNVDFGIISHSDMFKIKSHRLGYLKNIPDNKYPKIKQDAVLLAKAKDNKFCKTLYKFLKSEDAKKIIISYGYKIMN